MGIRADREAKAAQFVSVRDLLEGLAESEAITTREVAGYLLDKLIGDDLPRFLKRDEHSLAHELEELFVAEWILRYVSEQGGLVPGSVLGEPDSSDFDQHGWLREEMAEFLNRLGVTAPSCCSRMWKSEPKPFADAAIGPPQELSCERKIQEELITAKGRITELEKELREIRQRENDKPKPTKLMAMALLVQQRYWGSNWNPADPDTRTPQDVIVAWLRSSYPELSEIVAKAVEKVACPFDRNPAKRV